MSRGDIPQANEIDREAFPTQWPAPNYNDELRNPLSHYIVACDETQTVEPLQKDQPKGLLFRLKNWFNFESNHQVDSPPHRVAGFAGIWMMADEAHLVTIGVRKAFQRRGIGELLLIAIIELARELKASVVTLEVRVSNTGAQKLYEKYGFANVGLRRAYYTDNKEDAVLMSTESIRSPSFVERFQRLRDAHSRKWGITSYQPSPISPVPPDRR